MARRQYDTLTIGHISLDYNIDYLDQQIIEVGGAVIYSSASAYAGGYRVGVVTKTAPEDRDRLKEFVIPEEDIFFIPSKKSTSIRNKYHTADKERRTCTCISQADPFTIDDIPDVDSSIYHLAGLIYGDFDGALIRALSAVTTGDFGEDEQICRIFHNEPIIAETCAKDTAHNNSEGLLELNKKLRPGEIPNLDSIHSYVKSLFFDRRKYDLTRVGRYKLNKKLSLASRITGLVAAADVVDGDGVLYVSAGDVIKEDVAIRIQNAGINEVAVEVAGREEPFYVMGNGHVDLAGYVDGDPRELGITEYVSYDVLSELMSQADGDAVMLANLCREHSDLLAEKHITVSDILSTVNYIIGLHYGIGYTDNIDHLGNRRVRSVGELLQNQFRVGIARLERVVRERM